MSLYNPQPADKVDSVFNCEATEIQLLKSSAAPTSGNLGLSFKGNAITPIAFGSVSAASVQSALRGLPELDAVTVTGADLATGLQVKFDGYVGDAPLLVVSGDLDHAPVVSTIQKGRG